MKKINTNNSGRMPLWQADLDWLQQAYSEPINALVAELGLGNDYFAIAGCSPYRPDHSHIAMNRGWFWWGNQALPVRPLPSTPVNAFADPVVRLVRVTNANPQGARPFVLPDLTTVQVDNVWQDDYLQPSVVERSAAFTSGVRLGVGAWTLSDIIAHRHTDDESEWTPASNGDLEYKRIGRLVVLKGVADADYAANQPVATGLPAPLSGTVQIAVPYCPEIPCSINGRGELYLISDQGDEPSFNGIMYLATTAYHVTDPNTINDNPEI